MLIALSQITLFLLGTSLFSERALSMTGNKGHFRRAILPERPSATGGVTKKTRHGGDRDEDRLGAGSRGNNTLEEGEHKSSRGKESSQSA